MEQMLGLIANMGFPIVVSVYLLVRIETRLENLSESIHTLSKTISAMKE